MEKKLCEWGGGGGMDTNDWCIIEGVQGEAEKYGKEVVRIYSLIHIEKLAQTYGPSSVNWKKFCKCVFPI